ncbi:hypothetical protein QTP70_020800 [Hemibagrus guttatus]|uniref:Reverse transcriptase domain-containing protein n=1 Tax=Hemibagrus guttatus TaxID=175788 RepID=A0AAE0RGA8_9TELE|nr:hypothetical protein QTP70_020800 [Hemibagrus guttatus]
MHSSNHIIKFTDDTTVVGLISKNDESAYRVEVQRLTAWCRANNLSLNVEKTKEMVVDFRRAQSDRSPLDIDGSNVVIIERILSSCITAWFGNCTVSDRKTLQRIVRTAEKIIGVSLPSITDIYSTLCNHKANSIVDNPTHPSHTHTPLTHTLHPPVIWKEEQCTSPVEGSGRI